MGSRPTINLEFHSESDMGDMPNKFLPTVEFENQVAFLGCLQQGSNNIDCLQYILSGSSICVPCRSLTFPLSVSFPQDVATQESATSGEPQCPGEQALGHQGEAAGSQSPDHGLTCEIIFNMMDK